MARETKRTARLGETLRAHVGLTPNPISQNSRSLAPRTRDAQVYTSVCPFCAVGCSQQVFVKNGRIIEIEGNPASPINDGRLCPKGASTYQLIHNPNRQTQVLYRAPQERPLGAAPARLGDGAHRRARQGHARRRLPADRRGRDARQPAGEHRAHRRRHAGQRRELPDPQALPQLGHRRTSPTRPVSDTAPRCPVWATSLGRGGATTAQWDLVNADCIVIQGSNMAECHPVGFRFVMEARERGATIIHVDPRFTRTSATADVFAPIRPGTDIAFLGGLINYVLTHEKWFREYVAGLHQRRDHRRRGLPGHRGLGGVFSGYDAEKRATIPSESTERAAPPRPSARTARATERRAPARAAARRDAPASALRLPDPQAPLRALHAGDGRAGLRHAAGHLPARRRGDHARTPGASDHRLLLRRRLDAAHRRRAEHPRGGDPAAAARQHRPARRRHPGAARPRHDPGLDRHADALQPAARLPADAAGVAARRSTTTIATNSRWRLVAQPAEVHRQPAQGVVRRARHRGERAGATTTCPS